MDQMTHDEKPSEVEASTPAGAAVAGGPRRALATWGPAAIFAIIAAFLGGDIASDLAEGATLAHLGVEAVIMALALAGLLLMWRHLRRAQDLARDLQRDLDGTRADLARWRAEAQDVLAGFGAAIDRQFDRWELTPAERDVALLLLKGLSLKEIAALRTTSERTARQQSLAVYRKAGLAGRAELAAFFLEDLLLPAEKAQRSAGHRQG
jgi:DNA-binding CsgD family transcriptional regulator